MPSHIRNEMLHPDRMEEEPEDLTGLSPEAREDKIIEAAQGVIGSLDKLVQEQITAKGLIEERWLEDLRNYFGKYEETELADMNTAERSTAFVKLTRHKTNGWAARLSDLLMPTDGRNWGIAPTPLPKLVESAKEAVKIAMAKVEEANRAAEQAEAAPDPMQAAQMGAVAQDTASMASAYADKARANDADAAEARKRSDMMLKAIDDQLTESDYQAQCRDVIEDGCRLGTGILKGPLTSNRTRSEWREEAPADQPEAKPMWGLAQIADPMPKFERIDPWHFFPDMAAQTIGDAEFTFQRHLPTKKDLRRLALKLGFNKNAVRRLIKEGPGNTPDKDLAYLSNLRAITGEGDPISQRYVMWEYHGPLECEDVVKLLRAAGQEEIADAYEQDKDPLEETRVILHFCGNEVLKIAEEYPLDSGDPLYSVWNFEKGETSMFGVGVPNIMSDSQRAINGAWRMMMDNSALSVGPQVVIDKGAIMPQDGSYALKPLKVWLKSSTAHTQPNNRPFDVHVIPNNQAQLAGIIEIGKMFADEETSMPLLAQGEQGAATQTLGGMSMLFNSANVVFRRVVKSFDDHLTRPTITRAYDWNMQHNPDESVKGDMQIKALGTSVLLVREIQSQNLLNVMTNWTVHPVIGGYIKVREGLVKTLDTMMIPSDDVLYTQDEADKRLAEAAATAQPPPEEGGEPVQDAALAAAQLRLDAVREDAASRERIAQMENNFKMMEMQERTGLSRSELEHKYGIEKMKVDSKERTKAADIAIEERRGTAAAQAGASPVDAVGQGVG